MNCSDPKVSLVICVYNAGGYLRPALLSVMEQTHRNLDILLVDDGSTDGAVEGVLDLIHTDTRVRVFRQENGGKPSALNLAVRQMRGEFYAIHDADDLAEPRRIEKQLACLQGNPDVAAVFCGYDLILGERRMAPYCEEKGREHCRRDIESFAMPGHDPTAMYRRSLVSDTQYSEDLPIVEGYDYILRVGERHPMLRIPDCLYTYRIHVESVTKKDPARRDHLVVEVLRRACERRGVDFGMTFPTLQGLGVNRGLDPTNGLSTHFLISVRDQCERSRRKDAMRTFAQMLKYALSPKQSAKALCYLASPRFLLDGIRARRETR